MIREWFDNNIFLYIILGICGLGILLKFTLSMKYRMLIRASKRMGTSKNKLMRVLRLKFETCYKLKIGVNNVDTFVDKYVYRHRFCGILLYTWETISGELIIISVLAGSIFSILGLFAELKINDILSTFIAGVLGALVLISYDHFINLNTKRKVLKVNIQDYLENFLKSRLESGEFSSDLLEQYKKEYLELPNAKTMKKNKKSKGGRDIPELVAQIESAATNVVMEKPVDKNEELYLVHAEDEFDDAQLFVNHDGNENKDTSVEEEKKSSKKKSKKIKPEDEAELRRQAKKNELKRMIQEDKVNRRKTMPEFFGDIPEKKENESGKSEVTVNIEKKQAQISPFSRSATEKNENDKNVEAKQEKHAKKVAKQEAKQGNESTKKSISSEEAQIIEDILREYLA